MSLIPRSFINEILARCDVVEIIDARVPLKKKGNNHTACCPFHNEKTPSFTVSATKQFYHCFGCGANGNAIGFLMDYEHLSFVEAVEQLASQLGMEVPREAKGETKSVAAAIAPDLYQLLEQVARFYKNQLSSNQVAVNYLKQRGLTGEIAKDFMIGYSPDSWDSVYQKFGTNKEAIESLLIAGLLIKKQEGNGYYDRFRDRIMFPIRDRRGRVIGFGGRILEKGEPKYLNSPETPVFHKGSELYGLHEALQTDRNINKLIVVEGYMDVVALAQYGIRNAVATLGTATTADHIQRLFRVVQEVIFCFDGDRAGQAAAWKALEVTLPLLQDGWQVRFLLLPEGEDPDSMVRKEGQENFIERVNNASSLADFLFATLSQSIDLTTAEGKARLAKLAVPLINKLPAGVFQQLLFERLANRVRMDVGILRNVTKAPAQRLTTPVSIRQNNITRLSPMRLAIALLIQNPTIIHSMPEGVEYEHTVLPGSTLLQELMSVITESKDLSTGALLEYWRDRPEQDYLAKLAAWEINIPQEGIEQEFLGTLARLQQLQRENQMEALLQKGNLTEEERQLLQTLLATSKA